MLFIFLNVLLNMGELLRRGSRMWFFKVYTIIEIVLELSLLWIFLVA